MARPVIQIEGLRELQDALKSGEKAIRDKASHAVSVSTFSATNRMKASAPVGETRTLQNSISGEARGLSGRVTIGPEAYYWRFIEFGTIYQNARPFVRTTAELETPDFERRMEAVANDVASDFSTHRGGL